MGWRDLFTSKTPPIPPTQLDREFELIFKAPQRSDFGAANDYRRARGEYDQKRKYFGGIVQPTSAQLQGLAIFEKYGFGKGIIYKDRYGDSVHFPDSPWGYTDLIARVALGAPDQNIAHLQATRIQGGAHVDPKFLHPYVPPEWRQKNASNR